MIGRLNAEASHHLRDIAVVIPAYLPNRTLLEVVGQLAPAGFRSIVVIDDGSGAGCVDVFEAVAQIEGVRLLRHAVNLGKGAALKTAMNFALCEFPGLAGIVTVDADGQHKPADVVKVAERLRREPDSLILGARQFEGQVPLRSRVGNTVTQKVLRLLVGANLRDTQTGLRGIPAPFAAALLRMTSMGYDFELDMLVAARRDSIPIVEEAIETVYEPGNKSSHFNPLTDSMRIYFVLVRFCSVSLATALLDNLTFYLFYRRGAGVLGAQLAGRCVAVLFNYIMVRSAVFQAKDRHSSAFPRYLMLVVASGAASYAGITLVLQTTHIPALWAKIGVESLLFFANFAVERDWVFTRSGDGEETPGLTLPLAQPLLWAALAVPVVIEIVCFRNAHLFSEPTWSAEGFRHFEHYARWFFVGAVVLGALMRRWFLAVCTALVLVCSMWAVGPIAVGAVLLFVFSATIIGELLFGNDAEAFLAFPAGVAVLSLAIFTTSRLPIHYPLTYLGALLAPVAVGYRQSWRLAAQWFGYLRPSRRWTLYEYAGLAACAFLLGAYWLIALKPEVSTDGLDMHMAVAADMAMHHVFTFDFHKFVWALMPLGADWCYSAAYVLGGEYAARLLNFTMLVSIAVLLFHAARRFVSTAMAGLVTALFLSTPMVLLVTGSMFIENFVAAMALAGVVALWRFHETRSARYLTLAALLLGASVSFKLGAIAVAIFVLPFAIFSVVKAWPSLGRRARLLVPVAGVVLTGVAAAPYATAWIRTGNPVFPFANERFHSPYVGGGLNDTRYTQPLNWRTPERITFETHLYYEGQDGSFGFQYLLLLPLIAVCLIPTTSFEGRSASAIGLGSAVLILATVPNCRYLYPALPFLAAGGAAALEWLRTRYKAIFASAVGAAMAAGALNIWFLPCADWYHRGFYSAPIFSWKGRQAYLKESGPVREVIDYLNRTHRSEPVAFADGSQIAGLIPPVYTMAWHDYRFFRAMWDCETPQQADGVLNGLGIQRLVVDWTDLSRAHTLTDVIAACGSRGYSVGSYSVTTLRPDCEPILSSFPGVLQPGTYDDTDAHIVFEGEWVREKRFSSSYKGTIAYSDQPGSEFRFTMIGTGFRYIATKAFNRGEARVFVDGSLWAIEDLYNPATAWQTRATFEGLPPGIHRIAVRNAGQKNPASSGTFIDVDAIEVF